MSNELADISADQEPRIGHCEPLNTTGQGSFTKLLKKLMTLHPKNRGSLKEIMQNPWLNTSQEEALRPYSEPMDPWVSEEMINLWFEWDQIQDSLKSKTYNGLMAMYLILSTKKPQVECHTILLLKKLMTLHPKNRGSLKEIMQNPWLNTSQEEALRPYSEPMDPWVSEEMINLWFEWDQIQDSLKSKTYNGLMAMYLILSTKKPQVECHTILPDGGGEGAAEPPRELRCSDCIVWNRQQTWLCVVPLFIGFIGLGLSLMLLKWIVVGSVKEYVPTDLVDSKGMGQDPFFLSKPSSFPKAMETTTTTTSTTSPATPSAGGTASSRTPNRISTRLTTITRAPTRFPGHRVPIRASPRSTTARNTAVPPTVLSTTAPSFSSSTPGSRPPVPGTPSTQAMPSWPTAAFATSSYLHDSTPSWTLSPFQDAAATAASSSTTTLSSSSTTTTPETSTRPKFHTTTYSTERSEHFKPCRDKDLAYCLNDGECFVIETLTGSHKHCRCKEGYQGVRCDQFLPKTDSILSDPTDHLGIEFMESEEVYQRQVLSISCIIFGIIIVGMFCAAFYFKSKATSDTISHLIITSPRQLLAVIVYSKAERHPVTALEKMMESSFAGPQSFPEVPSPDRGSQSVKHHRSLSSCCSPGQRSCMLHRNAFRRTPPSPRSRLGGIVGPAYQQLEESRIPDQDTMPCQGIEVRKTISHLPIQLWCVERSLDLKYSSNGLKNQQNASINMQLPSRETNSYFNSLDQKDLMGYSSTRASSVPIIPSVGLEETCMQMPGISEVKSIKWCKNSYSADIVNVSIPVSDCLTAEQQEVKILLETVQEQIRILTDARRSEDYELASVETEDSASENTAFLPLSPTAKSEREAQFVLRNEIQRDSALIK
ncbi:pro-neuregulin-3, membrane-bound isoform [Pteropus vampyrus]|uniref:Pro-neuregulin-3, membrane-bound isoform n=1 Tax=Pteropus vampyrus TaxID=132908 RepID=A0A6P3PY78_PTEVA|nr:pro-neuregulin-3, membrane-bound isoform [Pteropus vampyrus]